MSIQHSKCSLCGKTIFEDICKLRSWRPGQALEIDSFPKKEQDICRDCWNMLYDASEELKKMYSIRTMFLDDRTVCIECYITYGLAYKSQEKHAI